MPEHFDKALLTFARQPIPGKVKTRLVPPLSAEQAAGLYGCMLNDIVSRMANLRDVRRFLFYEKGDGARQYFAGRIGEMDLLPQDGIDLGERMAEAFRSVFAMGHGLAVIIGTDAPDLPLHYVEEAFRRLESGECEVVFGPCEDGGYYLLGMKRLHHELFRDVPWSSGSVLAVSQARARENGITVSLLPVWHDVDRAADLDRPELLEETNGAPLTREFLLKRR